MAGRRGQSSGGWLKKAQGSPGHDLMLREAAQVRATFLAAWRTVRSCLSANAARRGPSRPQARSAARARRRLPTSLCAVARCETVVAAHQSPRASDWYDAFATKAVRRCAVNGKWKISNLGYGSGRERGHRGNGRRVNYRMCRRYGRNARKLPDVRAPSGSSNTLTVHPPANVASRLDSTFSGQRAQHDPEEVLHEELRAVAEVVEHEAPAQNRVPRPALQIAVQRNVKHTETPTETSYTASSIIDAP